MAAAAAAAVPKKKRGRGKTEQAKPAPVVVPVESAEDPGESAPAAPEIPKGGDVRAAVETLEKTRAVDGVKPVGYQVWWDLACAGIQTKELEAALKLADMQDQLPKPISYEQRMRQAFHSIRSALRIDFKSAGKEGDWTIYRPVRFAKSSDTGATGQHSLTVDPSVLSSVAVNRKTGETDLQESTCPVGQAVVARYEDLEDVYFTFQIRQILQSDLEVNLRAVKIKRTGGMYFVPEDTGVRAHLEKLQKATQAIGESDLYVESVLPGSDAARAAGRGTARSLDGKYRELLAAARQFTEQLSSGDLVSGRTLSMKAAAARKLRREAQQYAEILGARGEALANAAGVVAQAMTGVVDASVDVRAMAKAKDSKRVSEIADKMVGEIIEKAKASLEEADGLYAPTARPVDDDDEQ